MSDLDKFQTIHAANKFPSAGTEPSLGPGCDQIQHHRTSKKHKRRTLCLFFFFLFLIATPPGPRLTRDGRDKDFCPAAVV